MANSKHEDSEKNKFMSLFGQPTPVKKNQKVESESNSTRTRLWQPQWKFDEQGQPREVAHNHTMIQKMKCFASAVELTVQRKDQKILSSRGQIIFNWRV